MSDTVSSNYKKARRSKMTAAEKKAQQQQEWQSARNQWIAIAVLLTLAVVAAIVLISIFTEGELPSFGDYTS